MAEIMMEVEGMVFVIMMMAEMNNTTNGLLMKEQHYLKIIHRLDSVAII